MTRGWLIASYFISLAVLWLVTSIAASVWAGSVSEGFGLATAAPLAPPFYGIAVLVADCGDLSLLDNKFVLAVTCLASFLGLIGSSITALCKPGQKRWLVVSQVLLVVYWIAGAWVACLVTYALSYMPT